MYHYCEWSENRFLRYVSSGDTMVISCLKVGFLFGEVMRAVTPPPLCCEWNFAEKGEGDNEGFFDFV